MRRVGLNYCYLLQESDVVVRLMLLFATKKSRVKALRDDFEENCCGGSIWTHAIEDNRGKEELPSNQ